MYPDPSQNVVFDKALHCSSNRFFLWYLTSVCQTYMKHDFYTVLIPVLPVVWFPVLPVGVCYIRTIIPLKPVLNLPVTQTYPDSVIRCFGCKINIVFLLLLSVFTMSYDKLLLQFWSWHVPRFGFPRKHLIISRINTYSVTTCKMCPSVCKIQKSISLHPVLCILI